MSEGVSEGVSEVVGREFRVVVESVPISFRVSVCPPCLCVDLVVVGLTACLVVTSALASRVGGWYLRLGARFKALLSRWLMKGALS